MWILGLKGLIIISGIAIVFYRPLPLRRFLGTRNELVKIKHYSKKKKLTRGRPIDHFSASVTQESNSGPSYLEQIQLGVWPENQGLLLIQRDQAGKSRSPASLTGSGQEIRARAIPTGSCREINPPRPPASPTVSAANTPSSPADRSMNFFHFTPDTHSCMPSKSILVMKHIKILHVRY